MSSGPNDWLAASVKPVAVVTGASGGIGQDIVSRLLSADFRVLATSRDISQRQNDRNIYWCELDLADEPSINAFVQHIRQLGLTINVLVNNAGMAQVGAAESFTSPMISRQFQVNAAGPMMLTHCLIPNMAGSDSHIVNIGSLVGFSAIPFMAVYSASKAAIAAWSLSLMMELQPHGIHVHLVEPGMVRTTLFALHELLIGPKKYAAWQSAVAGVVQDKSRKGIAPEKVADTVMNAIQQPRGRRWLVGPDSRLVDSLKRLLPFALFYRIWQKEFGLTTVDVRAEPQ